MAVSGFVMDRSSHFVHVGRKRDGEVKEGDRRLGDVVGEFDGGVKVADKINEVLEIRLGAGGHSKTVVNVSTIQVRHDSCVAGLDLFFQVPHKEASKARTHAGTHSHTRSLRVVLTSKGEGVEGQNQFTEVEEGVNWQLPFVSGQEVLHRK